MIRVLIVDDSYTSRRLLRHIVEAAPDMQVVAELEDGSQAVEQVAVLHPDVILMDIVMPKMDGLKATATIMSRYPTPIVMVSGAIEGRETEMAFQAIKQGALTLLPKPVGPSDEAFDEQSVQLVNTLRAMAGVRVIHRRSFRREPASQPVSPPQPTTNARPEIVGMVASTGGPAALAEVLQHIPANFPLPVVVVQHIAADFLPSLVSWLNHVSPLDVSLATYHTTPQPGHIYFAPVGKHLCFDRERRFSFTETPPGPHVPSGDVLFHSLAEHYGAAAIGVILTGMGADGAQGLLAMRQYGAVTLGQNQATSAVYGMPGEAYKLNAVQYSLSLNMIAPMLRELIEGVIDA
jgi:two-component system, chemotaxis family, protein-glutamate methylesterase/glutaminase